MITTTELIKLLQDNEKGGISHRSRQISLTVNGRYIPDPQITISSTGDGIVGPEINLDVDGKWFEHEADEIDEVLDKIRAEIEQITSRYVLSCEYGGYGQVKWSDKLIKLDDALEIIDKYKSESEDKI